MAGFYNPFSAKPDYASGLQDLASQVMQMIMMKKMYGGEESSGGAVRPAQPMQDPSAPAFGPPTPQAPPFAPQGPQGGASAGVGGQAMGQAQARPQSPPSGPTPSVLGGQDISALASSMPPEIMQIILKLLEQGKFTQPGQQRG